MSSGTGCNRQVYETSNISRLVAPPALCWRVVEVSLCGGLSRRLLARRDRSDDRSHGSLGFFEKRNMTHAVRHGYRVRFQRSNTVTAALSLRRAPRFTQLVGLTRARGQWRIGRGGFLFRDYQIGDEADPRRGEIGGRRQSHPGSIDGGVESPFTLIAVLTRAREGERRQQQGSSCSTGASWRCGAATLAGAGVSDLAKLLVAIRGDDGAWAVTDAADGGIADRGGGRGSYRVIDFDAGKFCSGHIVRLASLAPGFRSEPSAENWPRIP